MIGDMIAKARKSKKVTKTKLAKMTDINVGHLTHIEKGERNPSHKALKNICKALNIPYMPLMFTYDKELNQSHIDYKAINYMSFNKILAVDNIANFIDCPSEVPSAAIAIKMNDDSMEPSFKNGDYIYVELNTPLNAREYGVFFYNEKILVRKFILRKNEIILKADNKKNKEIKIEDEDNFYIIGKVLKIK